MKYIWFIIILEWLSLTFKLLHWYDISYTIFTAERKSHGVMCTLRSLQCNCACVYLSYFSFFRNISYFYQTLRCPQRRLLLCLSCSYSGYSRSTGVFAALHPILYHHQKLNNLCDRRKSLISICVVHWSLLLEDWCDSGLWRCQVKSS